jgi:hypothetical protein
MILAKGKNGRIGRMVPGVGLQARVMGAEQADRRGDVYLSTRSIEDDQKYFQAQEDRERAMREAKRMENIALRNARAIQARKHAESVKQFQAAAKFDPMNEKLKKHFAKKNMMGETEAVATSLFDRNSVLNPPADFSSSGGNLELVPGERMTGGDQWSADYRQHLIVGNPLTRDGEYGPAVTDYDRYVGGNDVNQWDTVNIAGGTMLGRYDGQIAPAGMGYNHVQGYRKQRQGVPRGMGGLFDFIPSWDTIQQKATDFATKAGTALITKEEQQLQDQLLKSITGGGPAPTPVTSGGTTTYVVQQPTAVPQYLQQAATQLGVPKWALYTGIGLLGLGTLFLVIKAVKK